MVREQCCVEWQCSLSYHQELCVRDPFSLYDVQFWSMSRKKFDISVCELGDIKKIYETRDGV